VFDVLVVGLPDERWGECVTALLQPRPGCSPTLDDLQQHARGYIAGYKVPRRLLLVDEVPRLPNGKPDYRGAKTRANELAAEQK
jgi:acyl-CoA synthetase (AMP-forming)/AMP-acid ligase II